MTDRYSGFVVTLKEDMREDDAQATIGALRQIKGVVDVQPVVGGGSALVKTMTVQARLKTQFLESFMLFFDGLFKEEK